MATRSFRVNGFMIFSVVRRRIDGWSKFVNLYRDCSLKSLQSLSRSVGLSLPVPVRPSFRQSVSHSVCQSVYPFVRQSVSQSVRQSVSQSVCQSIHTNFILAIAIKIV